MSLPGSQAVDLISGWHRKHRSGATSRLQILLFYSLEFWLKMMPFDFHGINCILKWFWDILKQCLITVNKIHTNYDSKVRFLWNVLHKIVFGLLLATYLEKNITFVNPQIICRDWNWGGNDTLKCKYALQESKKVNVLFSKSVDPKMKSNIRWLDPNIQLPTYPNI